MIIVALSAVAAVAMLVSLIVVTIRIGPRAGKWNQPAAKLRSPATWVAALVIGVGIAHVVALGIVVARMDSASTGMRIGLMAVGIATLGMYVTMGLAGPIGERLILLRDWRAARQASQTA